MELAVKNGRMPRVVGLSLFVFLVLGCSGTATTSGQNSEIASVTTEAVAQEPAAIENQLASATTTNDTAGAESSRFLTAHDVNSVALELVEGPGFNQLVIHSDIPADQVRTSRLTQPERLVIDLPSSVSLGKGKKTIETADAEIVSRIRLGSHPDKTRFVVDLQDGVKNVNSNIKSENGSVVVTLSGNTNADITTPMASPKSEAIAAAAEVATKSETNAVALKPVLSGMRFEEIGPQANQLQIDMESAGFYTLKRTAPSEYVLNLEGATLSNEASQAIVAKPGTGKIRSVRPVAQGDNVTLRIFAAPDVALKAESRAGGIVVTQTSRAEESFAADPRAQFAPSTEDKKTEGASEAKVEAKEGDATAAAVPTNDNDLSALLGERQYTGRLISLDLQDTDIANALRIIAEVSNLNIVTTEDVQGKVTLRLVDVPWDQALDVILKINSLGKVQEGNVVRIAPIEKLRAEKEALKQLEQTDQGLEELKVHYVRISYAKASELKPLVEAVLSERGSVAYDERSNQVIIKDISTGIKRVIELVKKLDLRTPQVLLETQIVEAKRGLVRKLGTDLGYKFSYAPVTGNATGWNFPNSITGEANSNNLGALDGTAPGVIGMLFGSADGSRSLSLGIAAAENEGLAKVISRPSVATTNNKQATIKSVTKLRVKTPSGGNSVQVGQGGSSGGSSATATESIEAGITLEVTPQASPDYYVLLDVNAKSSSFDTSTSVDGIPSEVERSATSTILVSSGQTFVMGGIYKITENNTITGIPFLKDIPVLGHLFRSLSVDDGDEELLFFITPRIVEGSFDDAAMKSAQ